MVVSMSRTHKRRTREKMSEVQLAAMIVSDLKSDGWEVYQEVVLEAGDGPADIVAVRGGLIWIIETKMSMTLDLIGQAYRWIGSAHWVTMAIPYPKRGENDKKRMVSQFCRDYGVSLMKIDSRNKVHLDNWQKPADIDTATAEYVISQLHEEQKTFALAGSNGGHWTPYKSTCIMVKNHVLANPGCSIESLVKDVGRMHYKTEASARSTLQERVAYGAVPGVTLQWDGKIPRLFVQPEAVPA
jgi:hypothetical protein